jgi:hypothetical protein
VGCYADDDFDTGFCLFYGYPVIQNMKGNTKYEHCKNYCKIAPPKDLI